MIDLQSRLAQLLLPIVVLALAACSSGYEADAPLSATSQAKAAEMLQNYQVARAAENWEVAETTADALLRQYPESTAATALQPSLEQVHTQAQSAREMRRLRDLWDYQRVTVGNGKQLTATIYSRTVTAEEGEPVVTPDAQLVLRDHPSWGRSVYLLLAQSRFACGRPCAVTISFDDGDAQHFAGKQADSGKGPALFIEDDRRFIAAMQQAKRVRIDLPKGSGIIPALVFEVAGFDAARYEKP